jgi:predicted Ser/Thr protein kinase
MEKTVKEIDSSLTYIRKLEPSSALVYEVKKDGRIYVLKTTRDDCAFGFNQLEQEGEILRLAKGVLGITHLVQTYNDIPGYRNSLLKEFYAGQSLKELGGKLRDKVVRGKLEKTVHDLHSLGVVRLDLERTSNIVISSDEQDACIIDLGYGRLSRDVNSSEFESLKQRDLGILKDIFE